MAKRKRPTTPIHREIKNSPILIINYQPVKGGGIGLLTPEQNSINGATIIYEF